MSITKKVVMNVPITYSGLKQFSKRNIQRILFMHKDDLSVNCALKLLLEDKLDFYYLAHKDMLQFSKSQLKRIINSSGFKSVAKTGLQSEPRIKLNIRSVLLYQENIDCDILLDLFKLNEEQTAKTIKSHKKRFSHIKNPEFKLFLECI